MNINKLNKEYKKKGYVLIREFYPKSFCKILNTYCKYRFQNITDFRNSDKIEYRPATDGTLDDKHIAGAGSFYGDPFMEAMLFNSTDKIKQIVKKEIWPTYSYWRYYRKGNDLPYHSDRKDCKISATVCIGFDVSNLKQDYNWSIFMRGKKDTEIKMYPGDLALYNGVDIPHWRMPFLGIYHAQVFLHYTDVPILKNLTDNRPRLGLPDVFRNSNET